MTIVAAIRKGQLGIVIMIVMTHLQRPIIQQKGNFRAEEDYGRLDKRRRDNSNKQGPTA